MKILGWLSSLLLLIIFLLFAGVYFLLHSSLPDYNGHYPAAVAHPVTLERDALGYLIVTGVDRADVAFGLGFAHAQDRFFQMDLSRRQAAGELAELFGVRALPSDRQQRQHLFRQRAAELLTTLDTHELQILAAYSRGVNEGLLSLKRPPFEYSLLGATPSPWQEQDTLLVIFSMYLDLQGKQGRDEFAMTQLQQALPPDWYAFLQQHSADWQAAIDGSRVAPIPIPDSPFPELLHSHALSCQDCQLKDATDLGSNNFAVAGQLTPHGAAILADDMHLSQRVPGVWYKTQLNWQTSQHNMQVTGLSLPGTPAIVVGSNGHIAWGFTNSTADWHDLIAVELSADQSSYQTAEGWRPLQRQEEQLLVAGQAPEQLIVSYTEWGPLLTFAEQQYALRWVAHQNYAVNFSLLQLEALTTVDEAVSVAGKMGIPAQNLLVADRHGNIGWTIAGPIPDRTAFDWDLIQPWQLASDQWQGLLPAEQYPKIVNPASGRLWSANARTVGDHSYALLGNGGYDLGARGYQIAAAMAAREHFTENDLHQLQLDNQALLLGRWRELLLSVLTEELASQHELTEFRQHIIDSSYQAIPSAVGYTLLRQFRLNALEQTFAGIAALLEQNGSRGQDLKFSFETPFWLLWQAQRLDTLPGHYSDWSELILDAAQRSQQTLQSEYGSLAAANWGARNTAKIHHPLASALPFVGRWLNMPATPLAGDSHLPRVQHPSFGQSQRLVVAPGYESQGIMVIPAGQSGHPLSPFYQADHRYWQGEVALPFLPGPQKYRQLLWPAP